MKKDSSRRVDVESAERNRAFTPGWSHDLDLVESLPIKTKTGKVLRTSRLQVSSTATPIEEGALDEEEDEEVEVVDDDVVEEEVLESDDGNDMNLMNEDASLADIKVDIADICNSVQANPQYAVSKGKREDDPIIKSRKIWELFRYLEDHPNRVVNELSMLSLLLVFKDIAPSYFIRLQSEANEVQLKKETMSLLDYEKSLLKSYQRYLRNLEKHVAGLGNACGTSMKWTPETKFALSALRCACELLRALPFFNFRSQLLKIVVFRASQQNEFVSQLCCDTLEHIFKQDENGEVSFEAVRLMATLLVNSKYQAPPRFIASLECVKLHVRADDAKDVRRNLKKEKRKRKRAGDDVLDGLAEADLKSDKLSAQRFQADCLHEICLIYFRVIKMKVGFDLLPTALKGLSRISHLINLETVEDLLTLMRSVLDNIAISLSTGSKLQCISCALKTLAGPGEILEYDNEVFISGLLSLLADIYGDFDSWEVALECVELALIKRREARGRIVVAFIRILFLHAAHVPYSLLTPLLCLINAILLRYPRVRSSITAISNGATKLEDVDEVADLAMSALKTTHETNVAMEDDASWMASLLLKHVDTKVASVIVKVTGKDITTTLPFRLTETNADLSTDMKYLENVLVLLPRELQQAKSYAKVPRTVTTGSFKSHANGKKKKSTKKQ